MRQRKAYFLVLGLVLMVAHSGLTSSNRVSSVSCPFIVHHMTNCFLGGVRLPGGVARQSWFSPLYSEIHFLICEVEIMIKASTGDCEHHQRPVETSGGFSVIVIVSQPWWVGGEQRLWDGAGNVGQGHVRSGARFGKLGLVRLCSGV